MTQAWINQFWDTATFKTISLSVSSSGQEKKAETTLYDSIPCNLVEMKSSLKSNQGEVQDFTNQWRCDVASKYSDANRGDRVIVNQKGFSNTRNFIILKKVQDTDFNGNVLFYKYYLKEQE